MIEDSVSLHYTHKKKARFRAVGIAVLGLARKGKATADPNRIPIHCPCKGTSGTVHSPHKPANDKESAAGTVSLNTWHIGRSATCTLHSPDNSHVAEV